MLYINIEHPDDDNYKKKTLLDNISDLCKTSNNKSYESPEIKLSNLGSLDTDLKKNKKKSKKKKKKKDKESLSSLVDDTIMEEIESKDESSFTSLDIDDAVKMLISDGDEDISSIIIGEGRNYDKNKKSSNEFEKAFSEETTLLYDLLDEANAFSKKLMNQYDQIVGSKARGMSKVTTDLMSNINASKKTKLDIISKIYGIKKDIQELTLKKEKDVKRNGMDGESMSNENAAAMFMNNIMKVGRNKFISSITDDEYESQSSGDFDVDKAMNMLSSGDGWDTPNNFETYYDDDEMNDVDEMIEKRLSNAANDSRTADGDKYILYENRKPTIMIKKCVDTGEWEFIAVDMDNQEIVGYPLPTKASIGKIKFAEDGRCASDVYGRMYKVIEYYSDEL